MKLLIIPDVHQKIHKVKTIIAKHPEVDKIISLGDWFDDFGDTPEMAGATARYLLELQNTLGDRFVWILGNHDIPYVFPESTDNCWCSGVTENKIEVVHSIFEELDTDRLKLVYTIQDEGRIPTVLSHAGVHKKQFNTRSKKLSIAKIEGEAKKALEDARDGFVNPLLMAGRCRGGRAEVGGFNWLDWNYEFEPIPEINQIVGHTIQREGYVMIDSEYACIYSNYQTTENNQRLDKYEFEPKDRFNLCLDTHLRHYAILENNKLDIYEYDI